MPKILIIEDDRGLSKMVTDWLTFERYSVEQLFDGEDALSHLRHYQYDVLILDWQLPGVSGVEICQQFRRSGGTTPVLMLTGKKATAEKETGLDAGADDYLTKPFEVRELSARIRALLRRAPVYQGDVLTWRSLRLDAKSKCLTRGGVEIKLKPKELSLLEFLLRHPQCVFSANALLDNVWDSSSEATSQAVTTTIKRLRQKLDIEGQPSVIATVHGLGYKLGDGEG